MSHLSTLSHALPSGRSQTWQKTTQVKTSKQAACGSEFSAAFCCGTLRLLWSLAIFLAWKCIPDPQVLHVTKLQINYGFCFEVLLFLSFSKSWYFLSVLAVRPDSPSTLLTPNNPTKHNPCQAVFAWTTDFGRWSYATDKMIKCLYLEVSRNS